MNNRQGRSLPVVQLAGTKGVSCRTLFSLSMPYGISKPLRPFRAEKRVRARQAHGFARRLGEPAHSIQGGFFVTTFSFSAECDDSDSCDCGNAEGAASGTATHVHCTAGHWPLKLRLAPVEEPLLRHAHLLICGDCTAFASSAFHDTLSPGRAMLIGCPKFEDPRMLTAKLVELFQVAAPSGCTVARMEKPCCKGLYTICQDAAKTSGLDMGIDETVISCSGDVASGRG